MSSDSETVARLGDAYVDVSQVDVWAGGLAEDHVAGGLVGETFQRVLAEQFEAIRDGDRFWYQNYLPQPWRNNVKHVRLADIIRRNTEIDGEISDDVFVAQYQ